MVNTQTQQKLHALFIAYPLQGHVIPSVHLAIKLASKGFTITFINTQSIHHQISIADPQSITNDDIFSAARKSGLDIRYHTVSDGLPLSFDRSLNHDQFMASLLHVFSAHVEVLMQKIVPSSDPPITCLVADTFFVWPSMLAKRFNLLYISFWTEPALVFTLYYHVHLLRKNGHYDSDANREDTIDYMPGVPAIQPTDLMSYLQVKDVSTVVHQLIFKAFEDAKGADFVICNTVQELEPNTISALQVEKPFYAIGPVFPAGLNKSHVSTSLWEESDCTKWLESKPNGSVLYVSFGSYAHVSKHDIIEIAYGLLLSEVNFVWVLRPDIVSADDQNPLPEQFFVESRDRGMIVQWCRQTEVLSHPAIGGFFTHCGWNSILESIWSGVPFLCFPLLTDQFTNRKLIVDDWKVGLDINPKKSLTKDVVSEKIKNLMGGKSADEFKNNIKEVKRTLQKAIAADGSSERNFDMFVEKLKTQIDNKGKLPKDISHDGH